MLRPGDVFIVKAKGNEAAVRSFSPTNDGAAVHKESFDAILTKEMSRQAESTGLGEVGREPFPSPVMSLLPVRFNHL
jgi:hypothetical protein